jgi:hypothetical protein
MRADGKCRSCGAPLRWAEHFETGKRMPLDPLPAEDGNVRIVDWSDKPGLSLPIIAVGASSPPGITPYRYMSHFATCPDAVDWRKR